MVLATDRQYLADLKELLHDAIWSKGNTQASTTRLTLIAIFAGAVLTALVEFPGGTLGKFLAAGAFASIVGVELAYEFHFRFRGRPQGRLLAAWSATGQVGTVEAGTPLVSPACQDDCVGYQLALHRKSQQDIVQFVDSYTGGFRVRLDSGEILYVAAGSLELAEAKGERRVRRRQALRCLRSLGLAGHLRCTIPFQTAVERVVRVGDRVEVGSELLVAGPATHAERAFRHGYPQAYITRGRPRFRVLDADTPKQPEARKDGAELLENR